MRSTSISTLVAALLAIAPVNAFWRLPCSAPLLYERADPIVDPGKVSAHSHSIMGGNGFGFDMSYASTQASTCSSCIVTKDFSNYWVPNLYYEAQNGSFISVDQVGGATIYYLQRSDPNDPEYSSGLLAFPEGFRMLAGDPTLRSFTSTLEQRAINFACLGTNNAETNDMPNYNCPDGLRAQVFFPSCWDGVNLDSADHKSHMAYPSLVDNGVCPDSHPKRFISLFYEVIWDTSKFADQWYGSNHPFVFSNGDKTGYGYHGDFVNGWDVPTLQKAVTECTNLSGVVQDCPVFEFFSDDVSNGCKISPSVDEQVLGELKTLPGCNTPAGVGAKAVAVTGCGAPTSISVPENPFVDLTVSKKFAYLGCGTDDLGSRTLTGPSEDQPDMTVEKCVDFCSSQGYTVAGTEYSTQCYCGNDVAADRAPMDGIMGDCFMKCGGDSTENCGGAGTISLYKKCDGTCQNISYNVNNSTLGNGSTGNTSTGEGSISSSGPGSSSSGSGATKVGGTAPIATASVIDHPPSTSASGVPVAGNSPAAVVNPIPTADQTTVPEPAVVKQTVTVVPIAAQPTNVADTAADNECGAIVTVTVAAITVTVTEMGEAPTTHAAVEVATAAPNPVYTDVPIEPVPIHAVSSVAPVEVAATTVPVNKGPTSLPTLLPSSSGIYTNGTKHDGHGHGHKHPHHTPSGGFARPTGAHRSLRGKKGN